MVNYSALKILHPRVLDNIFQIRKNIRIFQNIFINFPEFEDWNSRRRRFHIMRKLKNYHLVLVLKIPSEKFPPSHVIVFSRIKYSCKIIFISLLSSKYRSLLDSARFSHFALASCHVLGSHASTTVQHDPVEGMYCHPYGQSENSITAKIYKFNDNNRR